MEEIRVDIIKILYAVEKEYGIKELLKRIKRIWNIDLTCLIGEEISASYTNNSITITTGNSFPIYTIELFEDYHIFIKTFSSYETTEFFDNNNNPFRKTAVFETKDHQFIALDEMDDERFKSRRILKTDMKDDTLNDCLFEKEKLTFYKPHIEEEFTNQGTNIRKVIKLPNNIATYHRVINGKVPEINFGVETASSINTASLVFLGRNKSSELLLKTLKLGLPNIQIQGKKKTEQGIESFKTIIRKCGRYLLINILEKNSATGKEYEEEYNLISNTQGTLTVEDLDELINYITKYIKKSFNHEILEELKLIKEELLISANQKVRNPDFFDLKFSFIDDFEHLAFDIYENLDLYDEKIEELLNIPPTEPPIVKIKI